MTLSPLLPALLLSAAASAWPDTPVARLQATAMLQSLELDLLTHDSATLVLDGWCARHRLAPPGTQVVAERVRTVDKSATPAIRAILKVDAAEPVRYRRVRLRCGDHTLSEADNWYVPARLTSEMNQALDSSDTSFGRVVKALDFRRRAIVSRIVWRPLPEDWDTAASPRRAPVRTPLSIPEYVIENTAVLALPDGTPFSHVVENYTSNVLAQPPPR